jgi:hypothetical protein
MFSFKNIDLGKIVKAATILSFCLLAYSPQVKAQPAPSACDPEYMDALEARAWMEAQREISQNQNLIAKPDSVLEYTCFDQFAEVLAYNARFVLFSENGTPWGIIAPTDMQGALSSLVGTALSSYIDANFEHGYIEERIPGGTATLGPNIGRTQTYVCTEMADVWDAAHCLNFIDEPNYDGFYTFDWYAGNDPRGRPVTGIFACTPPAAPGDFAQAEQAAYNAQPDPYRITNALINNINNGPYLEDLVQTFLNLLTPGACGAPIQTGITVQRVNFTPASYADAICSNPGCHYNAGGGCSP